MPHSLRAWASMTLHSFQLNKTTEEVKWVSHHFIQLQSIIKTKISKFVISWKRKTFWSTNSAKLQWKIIFIFNFIQFCESQAFEWYNLGNSALKITQKLKNEKEKTKISSTTQSYLHLILCQTKLKIKE